METRLRSVPGAKGSKGTQRGPGPGWTGVKAGPGRRWQGGDGAHSPAVSTEGGRQAESKEALRRGRRVTLHLSKGGGGLRSHLPKATMAST